MEEDMEVDMDTEEEIYMDTEVDMGTPKATHQCKLDTAN